MKRIVEKNKKELRTLLGIGVTVLMFFIMNIEVRADINATNGPNYYYVYGIYGIIEYICCGDISATDALDFIIIPVYEKGDFSEKEAELFAAHFPETEQKLLDCGALKNFVSYDVYLDVQEDLKFIGYEEWCTPYAHADLLETNEVVIPEYTIEDCDMYKYATTDVNVRTEPDTNAGRVGSVPQNAQVHVTGQTSNGWYRIEYDGINGFSVAKYFADKPIEVIEEVTDVPEPTPAPTAEPTPEPTAEPVTEPTATEVPEATEAPATEPTVEPTAEPESITKTEIVEQATPAPTEVPIAEPTTVPATTPVEEVETSVTETNNFIPYIIGGVAVVLIGVVGVIACKGKKK